MIIRINLVIQLIKLSLNLGFKIGLDLVSKLGFTININWLTKQPGDDSAMKIILLDLLVPDTQPERRGH